MQPPPSGQQRHQAPPNSQGHLLSQHLPPQPVPWVEKVEPNDKCTTITRAIFAASCIPAQPPSIPIGGKFKKRTHDQRRYIVWPWLTAPGGNNHRWLTAPWLDSIWLLWSPVPKEFLIISMCLSHLHKIVLNKNGLGWSTLIERIIGIMLPRKKKKMCLDLLSKHARSTVSGIPGRFVFSSKKHVPFQQKHVHCCFGVFLGKMWDVVCFLLIC